MLTGGLVASVLLLILRTMLAIVIPAPLVDVGVIAFCLYALYKEGQGVLGAASIGGLIVAIVALGWDIYLDVTLP